jgi:amino acid adenylation domain-containing protein
MHDAATGLQQAPAEEETGDAGMELFAAPASFAQRRLWLLDRLQPGSAAYNVPVAIRLRGPLRAGDLADALGELAARHETLRTAFDEEEGEPVQVIHQELVPDLPRIDLSALPAGCAEAEALLQAREEARRPFDLGRAPLLRALLLRLGSEEHLLVLNLHHIVTDGWSLGILLRELSALYAAGAAGLPSPLPELPIQYADFAAWQREWLQGELLEQKLRPWRRRLAGAPAGLALPTDRPRARDRPAEGRCGLLPIALGASLSAALRQLARASGTTLFMTLLAGLQALLSRHSGQTDLVVGSPVANRNRLEIEGIVGFFVNLLALRGDLTGDPSFHVLLERVREVAVEAFAHEDLPFEKLVEELRPDRRQQQNPLFAVLFAVQQPQGAPEERDGLRWELVEVHPGTAKLELSLLLVDDPAEIRGSWEYDADLYDAATIARLGRHFQILLADAAAHPGKRLAELSLLSAEERHQVAVEWNDSRSAYPRHESLPRLFAAQAARTPDAPALISGIGADRSVTYGELLRRARRLGEHLRALGVDLDRTVGVFLGRGAEMIEAWLGTWEAGGAYVPLDPAYPAERIAFMLQDSRVACVVTRRALAERLPAQSAPVVCLEDLPPLPEPFEDPGMPERTLSAADPDHLAYVIYTSGSTGTPKGVAVAHRPVVRLVRNTNYADFSPGLRIAQVASASFDAAVFEVWGALLNGAPVVLLEADVATSPEDLARALAERKVDTAFLTASLFHRIASHDPAAFRGMRQLLVGGEVLDPGRAAEVLAAGPPERLSNVYGPTENTVFSCCHAIREVPPGAATVPVGRPVANSTAAVLDAGLQPVPIGVTGELCLGGDGLARGYFGRPDLTAERFVPDPLNPAARLYRTGDLARLRPDGAVDFVGRADSQVKVRGVRIEPGEVEAALGAHPAVAECAVAARRSAGGDLVLVAWFVTRPGAAPPASELREHVQARLPAPLVPSAFVATAALPRTSNGKLDRAALPGPEAAAAAASGLVPPRTPVEEILAGLWAAVLRVERVGASDNFFDLGGHSLLATQLTSRVRTVFGIALNVSAVFESPTLAGLAARIEQAERGGVQAPPIVPVPRTPETVLPLSFAQQRLWFLDRLQPGNPAYNVAAAVRFTGGLDRAALEASFNHIAARHEVLRTTFHPGAAEPVQRVAPAAFRPLPLVDLGSLPDPGAEARRLAAEESARLFDLERGPVVRWTLLRTSAPGAAGEHALLFTLHHVAADGWSIGVLTVELGTLYGSFAAGEPPSLPPLAVQYADFAVWQRGWLQGEALEAQLRFWRGRLAGAPQILELPADRPRPAMPSGRGTVRPALLPAELTARLAALARREGATLFMTLLAGWVSLLRRLAGQPDLLVGTPVANRNRQETEKLIGFFVNTLVLRADLADDPSFRGLIGRLRRETLAAFAHQDLPFERLVEELAPERSLAHTPLFQVMFVLQNAVATASGAGGSFELPGLRLEPLAPGDEEERATKFDLTLSLTEMGPVLAGSLELSRDLFDGVTGARWLRCFSTLLEAAVENPEQRITDLPLLSPDERRQILAEGNAAAAPAGPDVCLHTLFAAQAARTPAAVAVVDGATGRALTYAELADRASGLARRLRSLGVGPEVTVGVCAGRTPETVAAILAVLEAGGAYVPLDPAYPAERLAFLVADARIAVLLTDRPDRLPVQAGGGSPIIPIIDLQSACHPEGQACEPEGSGRADRSSPDNLAYLIHTSGSTGRPKGVAVRHRSAVALLRWAWEAFPAEDLAGVLAATSFSFDLSVFELFAPLTRGGAVILAENVLHLPEVQASAGLAVTLVNTVPSALAELLRTGGIPATVRTVSLAGEVLPEALARRLLSRAGAPRLLNLYGPAEDTTYSTFSLVEAGASGPPPIGLPLPGTAAHVLDARLEPVPSGVAGELFLGGAGLARGYFHRPDLTAERFVPDPFGAPGDRLYRTGDRVRRLGDGRLDFLGRLDFQVKVRGFRIELGEIETVLESHPAVRRAAVLLRNDQDSGPLLAAYLARGEEAAGPDVRAFLAERLPAHAVPSVFVELESLPLTPSGKVDRAALRRIAPAGTGGGAAYVPPSTPAEEVLAGIWAEILKTGRPIGARDNFFELSGHSLLAVQVAHRIRQSFGIDLPLRRLFERATLAELAREIEAAERAGKEADLPPLEPVRKEGLLRASFLQELLWKVQGGPVNTVYSMPSAQRLRGPLIPSALQAALTALVRRHEGLRTRFSWAGGMLLQEILPPAETPMPVIDLTGLPPEQRLAGARELAQEDAALPFDLTQPPPFRARLIVLGSGDDGDHVLLLNMHHIVSDGWSIAQMLGDLTALYASLSRGERPALPDLPVQFADFAVWQRRAYRGEALEARLRYWRERFADRPPAYEVPGDRPWTNEIGARLLQQSLTLPREAAWRLREVARETGCTVPMTLYAALNALLVRYSARADVVINVILAGRNRPELARVMGYFATLLPVRVDLSGMPSFRELMLRARAALLEAYARQDLPLPLLFADLFPDREVASRTLLSRLGFNMLSFVEGAEGAEGAEAPAAGGLTLEPFQVEDLQAKYDLSFSGLEGESFIQCGLYASADVFDRESLEDIRIDLETLLQRAMADPDTPLSRLLPEPRYHRGGRG